MTRLSVDPCHLIIVNDWMMMVICRSTYLIVLVTRCEEGLPAVETVLTSHHVAQLPLLVLLGPRVKGHYIWVVVLAATPDRGPKLLQFLLDTDLLPRSVTMLFLLIILHGLNNNNDSSV